MGKPSSKKGSGAKNVAKPTVKAESKPTEKAVENKDEKSPVLTETKAADVPTTTPEVTVGTDKVETPVKKEAKPKVEKPKVEKAEKSEKEKGEKLTAKIIEFERECVSKKHTRNSIIDLAYHTFGGKANLKDGLNPREVFFMVGEVRVPASGIFVIS